MFLENKHKVIKLLNEGTQAYIIYLSDAKECGTLSVGKVDDYEIIAYGTSHDVTEDFCKLILPEPKFINNLLSNSMSNSYKCFCSDDLKLEQYIAHISARSSWDCLINSIGNPKYVVIIQKSVDHAKTDIV